MGPREACGSRSVKATSLVSVGLSYSTNLLNPLTKSSPPTDATSPDAFRRRFLDAYHASGLRPEVLAARCGVSGPSVYGWIGEAAVMPGGAAMLRLPKALGVTAGWLLMGQEPRYPGGSVEGQAAIRGAVMRALEQVVDEVRHLQARYAEPTGEAAVTDATPVFGQVVRNRRAQAAEQAAAAAAPRRKPRA